MNAAILKSKIHESGLTVEGLSYRLKINPATFYRKVQRSGNSFTIEQVEQLAKILNLTKDEINLIFFTSSLA